MVTRIKFIKIFIVRIFVLNSRIDCTEHVRILSRMSNWNSHSQSMNCSPGPGQLGCEWNAGSDRSQWSGTNISRFGQHSQTDHYPAAQRVQCTVKIQGGGKLKFSGHCSRSPGRVHLLHRALAAGLGRAMPEGDRGRQTVTWESEEWIHPGNGQSHSLLTAPLGVIVTNWNVVSFARITILLSRIFEFYMKIVELV